MAYGTGAWVAAAAAAKRQQTSLAEEKDMTQYTQDDLNNDWEFKIVRSDTAALRKPEVLNKLLEEEAQAGWVMLEKLDDSRIRFKRPRSARAKDSYLPADVDPYRTQYGVPTAQYAVLIGVMVGLALTLGLGVVVFLRASGTNTQVGPAAAPVWIPLVLIVPGFLLLLTRKLR